MPELSKKDKLRLLETMLESRHADLREQNLNRQGKGHFHVSGMGHEALAAISVQMEPDDYIVPFYRDRGLVLGRGMTTRQLALEYFAKRKTGSGGRMMPSHYSDLERHIWSVPTPTGSQLLPGCGMAWGIQLDGKKNVVVTTVGDAATRQGDFFEAVCFAKEKKLPVLFIVEDNGYGISSPTRKINPLALGVLEPNEWRELAGEAVQEIYNTAADALFDFVVDLRALFGGQDTVCDQLIFPAFHRIAFFESLQFLRAAIKFLIVRTGVTGKPFHFHPPKMWTTASAHFFYCAGGAIVNLLNVFAG